MNNEPLTESLAVARRKASRLKLPIKIIEAKKVGEEETLTFYFEAESRIDFRQLVQELNQFFKETIRLEQIGSRDVAKKIGSMGMCGNEICCKKFITEFKSITSDMITAQDINSSLAQCTGMCGKLMCCLYYECPQEKLQQILEIKESKKSKLAQKQEEENRTELKSLEVKKKVTLAQKEPTPEKITPSEVKIEKSEPKPKPESKPISEIETNSDEKKKKSKKIIRVLKKKK